MPKYKKKPVVIEAFKYDGDLINKEGYYYVPAWAAKANIEGKIYYDDFESNPGELFIKTLEGNHHASVGDYIIQGVNGEIYPCKPDIFDKTYEKVEECENLTSKIRVNICGCDDSTIFDLEVNESELLFMKKLSDISEETSKYGCQPIIEIEEEGK